MTTPSVIRTWGFTNDNIWHIPGRPHFFEIPISPPGARYDYFGVSLFNDVPEPHNRSLIKPMTMPLIDGPILVQDSHGVHVIVGVQNPINVEKN
jgi:hypothetical protein